VILYKLSDEFKKMMGDDINTDNVMDDHGEVG
jgi:hypothetical protein